MSLTLILIDVRYLLKAIFSFENGLNHQNHSSSGSPYWVKISPRSKISDSPSPYCGKGEIPPPPTPYCYLEYPV